MILPTSRVALVAILVVTGASLACKGDQGPAGPAGADGQDGTPGTANVIYSNWTSFVAANWQQQVDFAGDTVQLYGITASSITSAIVTTGAVLMYVRFGGSSVVEALPLVRPILIADPQIKELFYRYTTGNITVEFRNIANANNPGTFGGTGNDYRYIIIPGGVPGANSIAGVDLTGLSYDEVVRRLSIPK